MKNLSVGVPPGGRIAVLAGALIFLAAIAGGGEPEPPLTGLAGGDARRSREARDILSEARTRFWEARGDLIENLGILDDAQPVIALVEETAARTYLSALRELYRGRFLYASGREKEARNAFAAAMDLAGESAEARETSEAYRIRAEAGSDWMLTKGLGGIIRMAPKVGEWADRSLELDPRNAPAEIISAQGQINAPKSAGGDPEAAVRRLTALMNRTDLDDVTRYRGALALAGAYGKLEDEGQASAWCAEASRLFPGNPLSGECP